jgi:aquaporin Z
MGSNASSGANAPNYAFSLPIVFGIEVLATALVMAFSLLLFIPKD